MNNIEFDLYPHINKIYQKINDSYNFAFPNNSLSQGRVHQVFSRINVFSNILQTVLSTNLISSTTNNQDIFLKQVKNNLSVIDDDREWAYPNNNLSENRSGSALNCISSSCKNYKKSLSLLGNDCLLNQNVQFNLIDFLTNVSCSNYYNYAYPNNNYNSDKAHISCQMLLGFIESISSVVSLLNTNDDELKVIFSDLSATLQKCQNHINKAYPNNSFSDDSGHKCLSNFISEWKSLKEIYIPMLKNHFDKKEIMKSYEEQITNEKLKSNNLLIEVSQDNNDNNIKNSTILTEQIKSDELNSIQEHIYLVKKKKSVL